MHMMAHDAKYSHIYIPKVNTVLANKFPYSSTGYIAVNLNSEVEHASPNVFTMNDILRLSNEYGSVNRLQQA